MRIDAHQHFWKYDPVNYDWIGEDMRAIRQDFFPDQLWPLLQQNNFQGCIAVQAEQAESHNAFLLDLAEQHDFVRAVVGWIDLCAADLKDKLDYMQLFPKLKGFRHILQGEPKRDMMLEPAFIKGLQVAGKKGYTYDILIYPDQLPHIVQLVRWCPDQTFILDHLAKPYIKSGNIQEWRRDIRKLSSCENVYCKLSGMVTEADWKTWRRSDLLPYIDAVVDAFGIDRLLYGSDWPVCLVAASYDDVVNIVETYFSSYTATERARVFGLNAINVYNLKLQ